MRGSCEHIFSAMQRLIALVLPCAIALGSVLPSFAAQDVAPRAIINNSSGAEMIERLLYKADRTAPVMSQAALQAAIDAAVSESASTVRLTGNVYLTQSLKIRGLKKSITIDGGGYSLLFASPAQDSGRHILVTAPDGLNLAVTLHNMRLEGPGGGLAGGGISVASGVDIHIDYCVLTGNTAKEGGGVYNYNNNIYVTNSVIAGNSAELGGGLYSYYGNIFVEGSLAELSSNTATSTEEGGGAIYGCYSNIVVSGGGRFIYNKASGYGGAIYLHRGGLVSASSVVFSTNTALSGGAVAIGADAYQISMTDCVVTNNKAVGSEDGTGGFGGGVYRRGGGILELERSFVVGNTALFGGGIFTGSGEEDMLLITGSQLRANSAQYDGGAVYCSDRITSAYQRPSRIISSRIVDNKAERNGGGVYGANHAALTVESVIFTGNTARSSFAWDVDNPDELYSGEADIYKNNIRAATPSRISGESVPALFTNIYNNLDINFPVSFTVTFRPWGGRWADTQSMLNRRQNLFIGECSSQPSELSREGYVFGGWRVATVGHTREGKLWSFDEPVLRSVALDCVWLPEDEAVQLILKPIGGVWSDGSIRNLTVTAQRGGNGYQPDVLTRPGYRFAGWYNQANNLKWDFDADALEQDNTVLVARWVREPDAN